MIIELTEEERTFLERLCTSAVALNEYLEEDHPAKQLGAHKLAALRLKLAPIYIDDDGKIKSRLVNES